MNNQNLLIGIFLFFCLPKFVLGQEAEKFKGMWKGKLNDSVEIFEYVLSIDKVKANTFTGTTYSNGKNFYCETSIKGVIKDNKINIIEEKVITTNYPNKAALCLLSFFLTFEKTQLSGHFIPRNNFSTCGDGSVIFQKMEKKGPIKA